MKIKIRTVREDCKLKEMGIDAEIEEGEEWLYFNPAHLSCFWMPMPMVDEDRIIRFFLNSEEFTCFWTQRREDLLKNIIG